MRADMAAAYLDYETTGKLSAGIERSEAPTASATRTFNGRRVPVWSRAVCDAFIPTDVKELAIRLHSHDAGRLVSTVQQASDDPADTAT
jgi:hypothetical protein